MNHQTLTVPQVILQVAYQLPQSPTQLMTKSSFVDSGFAVPVFSPGDDLIACLNKAMAFLTAVASLRFPYTNNQLRTFSNIRNQATIQDDRVTVQQTEDLNTYDSDCNDLSNAQVVHMANISNYDSDVISEVPNSKTYLNDMDNQKTLVLEEESRSKMSEKAKDPVVIAKIISHKIIDYEKLNRLTNDFGKRFTPQQELLAEQAFWLRISNPKIESSLPPVRVEVPCELPKKRTTPNALIEEYFEKNDLKAQLKDKDTAICKLKDTIKYLRKNNKEDIVDHDRCDLATINKELENSAAKLLSENDRLCKEINHVKQVFKDQFNSIKQTRILQKEHSGSLINKLNIKSAKNEDLKGKATVNNAAQIPSVTTVAPGMFKLDLEPLAPKLVHNRESHNYYLKHTQEQADILRCIVEQAKAHQPLDNALEFTWNHSQLMNFVSKFLGTVRFENDQITRIMGYGDYQLRNVVISRRQRQRASYGTNDYLISTSIMEPNLSIYYENVGISHQNSVARTPQQNGVVERMYGIRVAEVLKHVLELS
nr:hypothetical protein [Tanacetum cinerariifolium]